MSDYMGNFLDNGLFRAAHVSREASRQSDQDSQPAHTEPSSALEDVDASDTTANMPPTIERGNAGADFGKVALGPFMKSEQTGAGDEQTAEPHGVTKNE